MGKLEIEVAKERRNANIQRAILAAVAMAGLIGMIAVAPAAAQALKIFMPSLGKRRLNFGRSLGRLLENKLVEFVETGGRKSLRLTEKGAARLAFLESVDYRLKKPKKWDKKWRMIIFDVVEKRKAVRDRLRQTLQTIGFVRLQNSVWIYPYDCEDLMTLLKLDFKIGKDVLYVIADKIENDKKLRAIFGLE